MARPCKPIGVQTGAKTKEDVERRSNNEDAISGGKDKIDKPMTKLSKEQKKIRKTLVEELSNVLTNVDAYILDQCCIAIDRLQKIEQEINENPDFMYRKDVISAKKQYFSEFVRLCTELSMSPQSRAKIANALPAAKSENPLMKLLKDDDD